MSIASVFGLKGRADTRQGERTRVLLKAVLLQGGRPTRVHILDLSRKGALAHAPEPPNPGEMVWMVCSGVEVLSRTAWVRGNRFGLNFDSGLPSAKLQQMLEDGRRALAADPQPPLPA